MTACLREAPGPRLQKVTRQEPAGPGAGWCAVPSPAPRVLLVQTCKLFWFLWSRPTLPVPPPATPSLVTQGVFLPPDWRVFQQFAGDGQNGFLILHHSRTSVHQVILLLIFIYQRFFEIFQYFILKCSVLHFWS